MIIAAMREGNQETRVAITSSVCAQYIKLGLEVLVETGAGARAGFTDEAYREAGARIISGKKTLLESTTILACVDQPDPDDLKGLGPDSLLIGPIDNDRHSPLLTWCQAQRISVFSMNSIPRISRAQTMDSLSSQANLAGYRAVLEAVGHFHRAIPMMITAAGMIHPAKVLILGAGVAGLQAIATAKRLGAVVYAFDVRTAAKEQVESLGAEFIAVEDTALAETAGGYANEMSEAYRHKQALLIDEYAKLADIVICTALIPGKKAPVLLKKETLDAMKPGSVVVDLATSRGGNCVLSETDEITQYQGITIIGYSNMAGRVPTTASELYATNVQNLVRLFDISSGTLQFDENDEIIKQGLLCHDGQYLPFQLTEA